MSTHDPIEPSYEIYAHTVTEMKNLLLDMKSRKEDINWQQKAEQLEKELKLLKKNKNYGLFWKEKPEEFEERTKDSFPVLEEVKELEITQNEISANIIIEWDNYHTLSVLSYTHRWQVDVIYIDPPYNTGNKDFIYNDHYVDREDDFRHSKWLSFMEKRLKLAKDLLKETGVIFISIDDNEQAQLKLLCDEIFSEASFHWMITWKKKDIPVNIGMARHNLQSKMEYVLVYSRSTKIDHPWFNTEWGKERLFPHLDNFWKSCRLENILKWSAWAANRETLKFDILWFSPPHWKQWQIWKDTMEDLLKQNPPRLILYKGTPKRVVYPEDEWASDGVNTFWSHLETGTASAGKKLLSDILIEWKDFDTVKPIDLIEQLIYRAWNKNALILDFFAWSGTTGHAVLALNKEDGGNRRFILCSSREDTADNPKKNICRDITYERVKRVVKWYTNTKWENIEGLGGNIRYLKTDFIQKQKWMDNIRHCMVERCSEMLCLKENIWQRIEDISNENMWFYKREDKYLAILFSLFQFEDFSKMIRTFDKSVAIYVFSRGQMTKDDFDGIQVPYSVEEIPDPILAVYKTIFWL